MPIYPTMMHRSDFAICVEWNALHELDNKIQRKYRINKHYNDLFVVTFFIEI